MRLLQVMAGAQYGGAEEFFVRLALAFEQEAIDQHVVIRGNSRRENRLRQGGVGIDTLPFRRYLDFRTGGKLTSIIRDWHPNIVLTWMSRASHACSKIGPDGSFVHVGRIGGYYKLKYFRGCEHLIANTPGLVEYICDLGWPATRVHYLPNFVSERRAMPLDRALLSTPAEVPLLLALGRLHENKAFDVLLKAMVYLPSHWLWLVGVGPQESVLREQVARLGLEERVRFVGWRDEVAPLFAAADILVCPSRSEPLGNVVLEAWVHQVPVVAAASKGLRQLIDDGVNGLLAPVGDASALAARITEVTSECSKALAMAGWESYCASFSQATVVKRYLEFFKSVAH